MTEQIKELKKELEINEKTNIRRLSVVEAYFTTVPINS